MKKFKYEICGVGFKTKKEVYDRCQYILNHSFGVLEGDKLNFIDEVFKMHPRYEEKRGDGEYTIDIMPCIVNPKNNMFIVVREDGSIIDFSYRKAVNLHSQETRIKTTLRNLVKSQVNCIRNQMVKSGRVGRGYLICEETGLKIKPEEMHLDHYPLQFEEIVDMWFKKEGLTIGTFKLEPPEGVSTYWRIVQSGLEKSYIDFL